MGFDIFMDTKRLLSFFVTGLLFATVLAFGLWMFRWQYNKADDLLNNWAQKEGYTIVSKEDANPPGTGPKDRYAGNRQIWYRVVLKDKNGDEKKAIVKLGSEGTGTLSDDVKVEWVD